MEGSAERKIIACSYVNDFSSVFLRLLSAVDFIIKHADLAVLLY